MALRMIEFILPEKQAENIGELLKEHKIIEQRQVKLPDEKTLVRILLDSEMSEGVFDLLSSRYASDDAHLVMFPVQAILPMEENQQEEKAQAKKKPAERIGREELYENIRDTTHFTRIYFVMIVLSTIVGVIGLQRNNIPMVIGAMVIAPLLGPNMALSLGTTLGDLSLLRQAILKSIIGYAIVIALSALFGFMIQHESVLNESALHTRAHIGDLGVALASGCAGALAFTAGMSATLVGVMVAVSLLPPLVSLGLLLGSGQMESSLGVFSLFLMNLICINLAGVITFLVQGIHPAAWWEKDRAAKASKIAIILWAALLAMLICLILLIKGK